MIITKKTVSDEGFGNILKNRLKEKKMSMASLGRTVGVHRTTISDYILGKYLPKEETFHRIHQVFPDKELYDAYFQEVSPIEPRANKQLIPEGNAYNYYKAKDEAIADINPIADLKPQKSPTLNDDRYMMYSLKHTLVYMVKEGLDKLCPTDFAIYEKLYRELEAKFNHE